MKSVFNILIKIIIPVIIGFGVIYLMFGSEIREFNFSDISWNGTTTLGLSVAVILLIFRETGLAWRFRALTDNRLRWSASYKVSLICDFTSAITPTSAGGSILSMIFLNREKIPLGSATAITMTTLMLDEIFFILFAPAMMLIVSPETVFGFTDADGAADLMIVFWIVYAVLVVVTVGLVIGLFFAPHVIARGLIKLFSLPVLRRWRGKIVELGDSLVITSHEIKHKTLRWWIAPSLATVMTWLSRFLIVNALFYAFFPDSDQWVILARQFVVWGLLIFTPTPGGSGVSEALFKTYYSDMVGGPMLAVLAIAWRIMTYYIFLIIGVILLPSYLSLSKASKDYGHNSTNSYNCSGNK